MEELYVVVGVLAGAALGHKTPVPVGALLGGMIGGLAVKAFWSMGMTKSPMLSIASQILVAYVLVAGSDVASIRQVPRFIPLAVLYSLLLLAVSWACSWILVRFFGVDDMTAIFATPPGGLTGIGITSNEVGADAPVTLLFHMTRIILIMVLVPLVAAWWGARP